MVSNLRCLLLLMTFVISLPAHGQEATDDQAVRERNHTSRLAEVELNRWTFNSNDDRYPIRMTAEPAMRWSHFDIGRYYGDLHVVTKQQRPVAVFAFFRWFHPTIRAYVCATSLDNSQFTAHRDGKLVWRPESSELPWKTLTGSNPPSKSKPNRLVQMRRIARRFSGEVSDRPRTDPTAMKKLRLLPQPIYRYSVDSADGALFAFANGTTPAVLLCVEADLNPKTVGWRYRIVRRWSFESRMSLEQERIWTAPSTRPPTNPTDLYYLSVVPANALE